MSRLLFAMAATVCCVTLFADAARASTNAATHYDRSIVKEPVYQSTPRYCLITIGNKAETKVWMVEDGKRLFVDKNANGDLTDDGPPLEPGKVRHLDANRWDFDYLLDAIPRVLVPTVAIEWPIAAGDPPLRTTQGLYQRCCYWDFYTTGFDVPKGVVVGKAKVTISLPSSLVPIELTTKELNVPVVAPAHDSASVRQNAEN